MLDGIAAFLGRGPRARHTAGLVGAVTVILVDVTFGNPTKDRLDTVEARAPVAETTREALVRWADAYPEAAGVAPYDVNWEERRSPCAPATGTLTPSAQLLCAIVQAASNRWLATKVDVCLPGSAQAPGRDEAPELLSVSACGVLRCCARTSAPRTSWRDHVWSTGTDANRWSQYVPGGNTAGSPVRHRSRALAYSVANARLRSSASTRAHLLRPATRGRRFRRGSTLAG